MKYKLFLLSLVLVLLVGAGLAAAVTTSTPTPSPDVGAQVKALDVFGAAKWTVHYRAPNDAQIETFLESHGISPGRPRARRPPPSRRSGRSGPSATPPLRTPGSCRRS